MIQTFPPMYIHTINKESPKYLFNSLKIGQKEFIQLQAENTLNCFYFKYH